MATTKKPTPTPAATTQAPSVATPNPYRLDDILLLHIYGGARLVFGPARPAF